MTTFHIIVLALLQGVTEFLPISSSAHLILLPAVTAWPDQGLAFDVAAHLGSLAAVCAYFRHDILALSRGWCVALARRESNPEARLAWAVLLGTIPVGLVGLVGHDFIATNLRSPFVIAATTVIFGVLLWLADRLGARRRELGSLGWRDILLIGAAQALALIPGVSRSGITMTAALAAGLSRAAGARFSFLLSIPVIVLAGGLEALDLASAGGPQPWGQLALVAACSGFSALVCIVLFLRFIERVGMWPFAVYRLLLGAWLVWMFW